jgi:hypothetical protein
MHCGCTANAEPQCIAAIWQMQSRNMANAEPQSIAAVLVFFKILNK